MEFKVGNKYVFDNAAIRSVRKLVYKGEYEMCFESGIGELFCTYPDGRCLQRKYGDVVSVYREPKEIK
jgi:hypothetical protein